MASSTTARAKEVIAELNQFEVDMHLVNQWVHGSSNQTVLLGGVNTPTIKNLVKNFQLSAQEILDAAEYIQDNYEGLEDIVDANREYAEIAETLLLKIADWMARDLAEFNAININRYNEWYVRGIEKIAMTGDDACAFYQRLQSMIAEHDEETIRTKLMIRMFNDAVPTAGSKPVLFIVAGQSNAVGSCDQSIYETAEHAGKFWAWRNSPRALLPLKDPVHNAYGGTAWPEFGRKFYALTGHQIIMLNVGFGSSAVTDGGYDTVNTWADNGYGNVGSRSLEVYESLISYLEDNEIDYELGGLLWIQGETDASRLYAGTITVQDYIDGTLDVFSWFRNTMTGVSDMPIFISKTGSSEWWEANPPVALCARQIREAQDVVCASNEHNHMSYTLALDFIANGYTSNNTIHYSQIGYNLIADAFARQAVHVLSL